MMDDLIRRLRNHALPDPCDERPVLHADLLTEAAGKIEELEQCSPAFDFDLIYVSRDNDPYYVTRWDLAKPIRIRAETTKEAFEMAGKVLGDAPIGRRWLFEVKKITDSRITDSLKVPPNACFRGGGEADVPCKQ